MASRQEKNEVGYCARKSGSVSRDRWAHDPPEARKVRRAANKAYQLPRRRGLLNGEEEWRTKSKKRNPEGLPLGKLISFNLAGDQRPPTSLRAKRRALY